MKKGVIIELKENKRVVLGDNGRFYIFPAKKGDVTGKRVKIPAAGKKLAALTATALFMFAAAIGGYYTVRINSEIADTLIQIEINPAAEFLVNKKGKVVSAAPLNADAAVITADADYTGENIASALKDFVELSLNCGFINFFNECSPVFVFCLNDDKEREREIGEDIKKELESLFAKKYIRAVIIQNAYSQTAREYALSAGCEADRVKAVYAAGSIIKMGGDERPLLQIMRDYKDKSAKELINIIRQGHIMYSQSISDEKKQIFINAKNSYINSNINKYSAFIDNSENIQVYDYFLRNKPVYEQSYAQNNNTQIISPLYTGTGG